MSTLMEIAHDENNVCCTGNNIKLNVSAVPLSILESNYYHKKADTILQSYNILAQRLEKIAESIEDVQSMQSKLHARELTLEKLQQQISKLKVILYREREHVLQLFAEVDRLKVRDKDQQDKINDFLRLFGKKQSQLSKIDTNFAGGDNELTVSPPSDVVTILSQEHMQSLIGSMPPMEINQSMPKTDGWILSSRYNEAIREVRSHRLTIKSLQKQLEEQANNSHDLIETLTEDQHFRIQKEKDKTSEFHDREISMQKQLADCQKLLLENEKDCIRHRQQFLEAEKCWIAERDYFIEHFKHCSCIEGSKEIIVPDGCFATLSEHAGVGQKLPKNKGTNRTIDFLHTTIVPSHPDEPSTTTKPSHDCKAVDHISVEKYSRNLESIIGSLRLAKQRYRNLERRRKLESEGYCVEISSLRKKISEYESKLFNVKICSQNELDPTSCSPGNIDVRLLQNVRQTSLKSKTLAGELRQLKLLMYNLEDEIRNL